ncbi:PE family protein [Mycobacterium riyadhense]|uniref:PE family protein n=1 Tax=Mycobacterium riyadhense TaxID=486698 RepID=UPI00195289A7|nr:PE family protein [Mycobacterium riyadhense]
MSSDLDPALTPPMINAPTITSVAPDPLTLAVLQLSRVGAAIEDAVAGAATQTSNLLAAAADEISTAIAALFGDYSATFHSASTQAAAFHRQFVSLLGGSAAQYVAAEAANVQSLSL